MIEQHIRSAVNINEMQFGFMPGKGTMEAIFIIRQLQEKYLAKERTLYFIFFGLKKTIDCVPRTVVRWALRKIRIAEWIIEAVMAL